VVAARADVLETLISRALEVVVEVAAEAGLVAAVALVGLVAQATQATQATRGLLLRLQPLTAYP
jgi:hypothetical protein